MVTMVISELKSVSRLKILPETGPRCSEHLFSIKLQEHQFMKEGQTYLLLFPLRVDIYIGFVCYYV